MLVLQLVQQFGAEMIGVIVLFAGLIQFAAGTMKLGQWFRAVSPAVIYGMLAGIGILIFAAQFHVMLDGKPIGTGIQNLMGIPGADDIMLNYQSTSFHDALYVRETLGLKRAPEFEEWLRRIGLTDERGVLKPQSGMHPLLQHAGSLAA